MLIHWSIPKLISHHLMENDGKLTVLEQEKWINISLRERMKPLRNRCDLVINLEDIVAVRRKINFFPCLKEQINMKLLIKMERELRRRKCEDCGIPLQSSSNEEEIACPRCGVCSINGLCDDLWSKTSKRHNKVPYHKIRCLKLNIKQLLGNYSADRWFSIYETIKDEMNDDITLLELRDLLKKYRKSKAYPMANAILFHHRKIHINMTEDEKNALFHLFQIYHDGYVRISRRSRKTMRFSHFILKVLPCLNRKDLRKFVVDIKDKTKKKNMNLMFKKICKNTELKNQMKYYRIYFTS